MGWLAIVLLSILPGAYLGCGRLTVGLSVAARLALSIAFSPLVVALQFLALHSCGIAGATSAHVILAVNLPATWFLVRAMLGRSGEAGANWTWTLAVFAAPVLYLVIHWLAIPHLRTSGWHNLMQVDICNMLNREPLVLEEPELAGIPLAYNWIGHFQWTAAALVGNCSVTAVYSLANILMLLSVLILVFESTKALTKFQIGAFLAVGLVAFASCTVKQVAQLTHFIEWDWAYRFGDIRMDSFLHKFLYLDLMPFSFASFAAVLFLCLSHDKLPAGSWAILVAFGLLSNALLYTIAYPATLLVVLTTALGLALGNKRESGRYWSKPVAFLLLASVLSMVVAVVVIKSTASAGSSGLVEMYPFRRILLRASHVALTLWLPGLLALPAVISAIRGRQLKLLGMAVICLVLVIVYSSFSLRGGLEYKYILYAKICLCVLAGVGAARYLSVLGRFGWVLATTVFVALGGITSAQSIQTPVFLPRAHFEEFAETSFVPTLPPESPHAGWIGAIRDGTPLDTIVLSSPVPLHACSFFNRALFFPCDEIKPFRPGGYGMYNKKNLLDFRGHSEAMYEKRRELAQCVSAGTDTQEFALTESQIRLLGRPMAIHLQGNFAFSQWLTKRKGWTRIYADESHEVWYSANKPLQ
jgi:hypothetical protein